MPQSSEYYREQLNELQHENERLEDEVGDLQVRVKELEGALRDSNALLVERTKERNALRQQLLKVGLDL